MNGNQSSSYTNFFATCLPRFSSGFPRCNQMGSVRAQRSISQTVVKEKDILLSAAVSKQQHICLPPPPFLSSPSVFLSLQMLWKWGCALSKYTSSWMLCTLDFHFFRFYTESVPLFSDFYPLPIAVTSDEIIQWANLIKAQVSPFPQHGGTNTYNCVPANLAT